MVIQERQWDSRFFGYSVADVMFAEPPDFELDLRPALRQAVQAGIRLLYVRTPPLTARHRRNLQLAGACSVGTRVEFVKNIQVAPPLDDIGAIHPCREHTPALLALALESGAHSRFRMDPGFNNGEFARLYDEWLASSLRGEGGKRVFIAGNIVGPDGLITLEPDTAVRIGLLAVAAHQRGQGLGRRLVAEAERFCFRTQRPELSVATQAENHQACRFYDKCGFRPISEVEYFHVWLPPAGRPPPSP